MPVRRSARDFLLCLCGDKLVCFIYKKKKRKKGQQVCAVLCLCGGNLVCLISKKKERKKRRKKERKKKRLQQGVGQETRSGTDKRCSHNLQSGHPAWGSADNRSVFPTVNVFRLLRRSKLAEEIRNA